MFSPVINTTISNGMDDSSKLMAEEKTRDTGYIYFGIATFVISDTLPVIEPSPFPTDSLKKLNKILALSRYTGKFSIPDRNMVENTIY